jgi:hypothetical protein
MLLEAYGSDPGWAARGPAACEAPAPIRAGRLVLQILDDVVRGWQWWLPLKGQGGSQATLAHQPVVATTTIGPAECLVQCACWSLRSGL